MEELCTAGLKSLGNSYHGFMVSCRRKIHRFAEIGGNEIRTSAMIAGLAERLGLPYEHVSATGLIVDLMTGKGGPGIALRADMDALNASECPDNLSCRRDVVSDNPGTAHLCGHDAHCAILMAVMDALAVHRQELEADIHFCFEEGEENGSGFRGMMEALGKRKIDTVWALHVRNTIPAGRISIVSGPCMSALKEIEITVKGSGGHSSEPAKVQNPVMCAAEIVSHLGSLWMSGMPAGSRATLAVTSITGGSAYNIIPDEAKITGSLRYFSDEECGAADNLIRNAAQATASLFGCRVGFSAKMDRKSFPVFNDPKMADIARAAVEKALPGSAADPEIWYASESFKYYTHAYPGVMAFLGIRNEAKGTGAPHHSRCFDIDEDCLDAGFAASVSYVLECIDYFKKGRVAL